MYYIRTNDGKVFGDLQGKPFTTYEEAYSVLKQFNFEGEIIEQNQQQCTYHNKQGFVSCNFHTTPFHQPPIKFSMKINPFRAPVIGIRRYGEY